MLGSVHYSGQGRPTFVIKLSVLPKCSLAQLFTLQSNSTMRIGGGSSKDGSSPPLISISAGIKSQREEANAESERLWQPNDKVGRRGNTTTRTLTKLARRRRRCCVFRIQKRTISLLLQMSTIPLRGEIHF